MPLHVEFHRVAIGAQDLHATFTIGDAAKFIPAGSDIIFECHYVPSGKPETDRSRVGIVLASAPPEQRYLTVTGINSNIQYISFTGGNGLSNIGNLADPVNNQNGFGSVNGARDPRILQTMIRIVF